MQSAIPKFLLGRVLSTPGALLALEQAGASLSCFLRRHQCGDWGEACEEDAQVNGDALRYGGRLFSVYLLGSGVRIWLITEADRSSSTILLPSEY